ncbi:MAG: CoA transferase [Chloroflexota bacterium]
MAKALAGIRVVDFTRMYAGPFCSMLLAELGAEVIKVEFPESGDAVRGLAPQTEGLESYIFVTLNRGKKSITLNLRSEAGQRIAQKLISKCDILLENFTPGIMERFKLGYERIKVDNPSLIYTAISGFGYTGPYCARAAFDTIIQAMGGLLSVNGPPGGHPSKVGPAIADFLGGLFATTAILAALQHRASTKEGQFVDISMQDCIWLISAIQFLPSFLLAGKEPKKLGNRNIEVTPFNIYPAKDGYIVIAIVTVSQWQRFLEVIGREELKNVPEYASQFERIKHVREIDGLVEDWTRKRTVDEMLSQLNAADLPCAPVPSFSQVAHDPQLASRQMLVDIEQLISGKLTVPGSLFKMSQTPGDATQPAPFLGQDNTEVYTELLGYGAEKLAKLQNEGTI